MFSFCKILLERNRFLSLKTFSCTKRFRFLMPFCLETISSTKPARRNFEHVAGVSWGNIFCSVVYSSAIDKSRLGIIEKVRYSALVTNSLSLLKLNYSRGLTVVNQARSVYPRGRAFGVSSPPNFIVPPKICCVQKKLI